MQASALPGAAPPDDAAKARLGRAYRDIGAILDFLPGPAEALLLSPESLLAWRVIRQQDATGYLLYLGRVKEKCARHVLELVVHQVGNPRRAPPREIVVLTPEQLQARPAPSWLIPEIAPASGLAVAFGEPGSGKSFAALDMALSVASGAPWHGVRVKQGAALLVAAEGSIKARLAAYEQHHGIKCAGLPLRIIEQGLAIRGADSDLEPLLAQIRAVRAELGTIALTVLDTLARLAGGANESASEDMAEFITAAEAIAAATGGLVLTIHHAGKNLALGARGHSSLRAAVDAEYEVSRSPGGIRQLKVTKLRDAPDGRTFSFRLETVDLGQHPDPEAEAGERWTSCVCVPVDATPAPTAPRPRKLPAGPTVALDALRKAIAASGEPLPATSAIPAGTMGARHEAWAEAYRALRPIAKDLDPKDAKREANARRTAFHRAQEQLQAARMVGTAAGFWWIA